MKTIYSSPASEPNPILVLSLEDLTYTTSFSEMEKGQTHIPMFEDKEYFYLADGKFQGFRPTRCLYGFRYQMEDGQMSRPYTAVFCTIDGKEAVILAEYAQSSADDEFDNMSPYSDCYGVWKFWSNKPSFYGEINSRSNAVDSEGVRRSYDTPKLRNIRYDINKFLSIYPMGLKVEGCRVYEEEGIARMVEAEVEEYGWDCRTRRVIQRYKPQDGHEIHPTDRGLGYPLRLI